MALEMLLALVAVVLALCFGNSLPLWRLRKWDRKFHHFAGRRHRAVLIVFLVALFGRIALLRVSPVPEPHIHDEFSYLLAADTFASGRLTNPTPPFWEHFETMHVLLKPTYMSMYPPGPGLMLALGQRSGDPWIGVLLATAAMCAGLTWALQGWMPPGWAFLGGLLAVLRIGTFSYWVNSYFGGSLAALGGVLVVGAMGRFLRRPRIAQGTVAGLGAAVLALTRPYEGLVLCLAVAIVLLADSMRRRNVGTLLTRLALPVALIMAVLLGWFGYYCWRVTGSPIHMGHSLESQIYGVAPRFFWQNATARAYFRHDAMASFYAGWELDLYLNTIGLVGAIYKFLTICRFYFAYVLIVPLVVLVPVSWNRMRPLWIVGAIVMLGYVPEVWMNAHYAAPALAIFYALILYGMRYWRTWPSRRNPKGLVVNWLVVAICLLMVGIRAEAGSNVYSGWPPYWETSLGCLSRRPIVKLLQRLGGKHVIFVRYGIKHDPTQEWVYNDSDLERAPIIWAREIDPQSDAALIEHFRERRGWLLEPDKDPNLLYPYPSVESQNTIRSTAGMREVCAP